MNCGRPKTIALLVSSLLIGPDALVVAKDPIVVTDADGTRALSRDGLIDFLDDLKANPRNATLTLLDHDFVFSDTTLDPAGALTSVTFKSTEMGINKTFTGTNTTETTDALKDFLKSNEFLGPFYRTINAGSGGATFSGAPTGTIDQASATAFQSVTLTSVSTQEEADNYLAAFRGVSMGAGFSKFDNNGFKGSSIKVSPGYSWTFGTKKDHQLNWHMPAEKITVEGLRFYRVGMQFQFVKPFYWPGGFIYRLGPDVSYSMLASEDVPSFAGTIGGGLTNTLSRQWGKYFTTVGYYFGRFQNLGGIDTGLQANVHNYGAQVGRRLFQRWVVTAYGFGVSDIVNGAPNKTYSTFGSSIVYRIMNRFNLEMSVNKTYGLAGFSNVDYGLGSAWGF